MSPDTPMSLSKTIGIKLGSGPTRGRSSAIFTSYWCRSEVLPHGLMDDLTSAAATDISGAFSCIRGTYMEDITREAKSPEHRERDIASMV